MKETKTMKVSQTNGRALPPALAIEEEHALIRRAAAGEIAAQERLLAQYKGMIVKESRQPYLQNAALAADAPGIATLAFLEAIRTYDAGRGIQFAGYAASRVHMALYVAFRRERRLWNTTTHPEQSFDAGDVWERIGGVTNVAEPVDEGVCRRLLLRQAIAELTAREKKILRLIYFEEATTTKIAKLMNVTHQAISFAKKKILNKLRISITRGEESLAPI